MLSQAELRILGERRWALPVLAALADQGGESRFVVLLNAVGCARSTLVSALGHLIDAGWIRRNTGHGHPLRPEYLLTPTGAAIAARANAIGRALQDIGLPPKSLQRWTLPIAAKLRPTSRRFTQLKEELAPATPRALSLTLKQMIADELVVRDIVEDFPPTPLYGLSGKGRELAAVI